MRLRLPLHHRRHLEADDALEFVQRCFQRALFACKPTHDHGEQHAIAVIRQTLPYQGEAACRGASSYVNKQPLARKRECLYFQLDH